MERVCFGVALLLVKKKTHATFSTNQVICLHMFSRASRRLHVLASSFDWFTGLSVSLVTGLSDYFGFGIVTLNR